MKKRIISFFCGALVALVGISTALASGVLRGTLQFNFADFRINGHEVLSAGEYLVTENGAQVPSSILYTDEYGGGTYYVPVRELAQQLSIPTNWDAGGVYWHMGGDYALALKPEVNNGGVFDDFIEEINAIIPEDGVELFSDSHNTEEDYEAEIELVDGAGDYVSITVTNNSNWRPIEFDLGIKKGTDCLVLPTRVPIGKTITRTFRVIAEEERSDVVPFIRLGSPDEVLRRNLFTVTAVQFDAEYEEAPKPGGVKIDISGGGSDTSMTVG